MNEFIKNSLNKINDTIFSKVKGSTYLSQLLDELVEKTGIPGPYIVTSLTAAVLLIFVLSFGSYVLLDLLAVLYPAFESFQALEEGDWRKSQTWLQYWIVFGMVSALGRIGDSLLFWLPGYYFLKFLFLLWCFAPVDYNGSAILYENYIQPGFVHFTDTAEVVIENVRRMSTLPAVCQNQ